MASRPRCPARRTSTRCRGRPPREAQYRSASVSCVAARPMASRGRMQAKPKAAHAARTSGSYTSGSTLSTASAASQVRRVSHSRRKKLAIAG